MCHSCQVAPLNCSRTSKCEVVYFFNKAPPPLLPAGSVYRDEFDLAILKMQEDNRLEILKRKWWDGGKCPKEEDHRAKGSSVRFGLPRISSTAGPIILLSPLSSMFCCLCCLQVWGWRTLEGSSWCWCAACWWLSSWPCWSLSGC